MALQNVAYPSHVTVVRHALNLGTSGAVKTGLEYALEHNYDWIWILDADSVPRPNALELLMRLIENEKSCLGAVCTSHNLVALGQMLRGRVLTPGGPRLPKPLPHSEHCRVRQHHLERRSDKSCRCPAGGIAARGKPRMLGRSVSGLW